jgi:hypothetical protein
MRNRAKCKLCQEILESFLLNDYIECKCGEIAIAGGNQKFITYARDFANFLRIDDDNKEIPITFTDYAMPEKSISSAEKLSRADLLEMLDEMGKGIERLPQHAMMQPITHADHYALILILLQIMRAED